MVALFAQQSNILDFPQPQKSNEWYTPARYIEAAREVMGSIDLDPASCKEANMVIRAEKFYTKVENGFTQPWYGNVWLNPPYGKLSNKSMLEAWVRRLVQCYKQGDIKQAVLLATTNIEAPWFSLLWEYPLCFVDHEIRFYHPQGIRKCHLFGTTFAYLGPHEQKFIDVFSKFGTIAKRVSQPRQTVTPLSLWEVH